MAVAARCDAAEAVSDSDELEHLRGKASCGEARLWEPADGP